MTNENMKKTNTNEQTFYSGLQNGVTESLRDLMGIQMRSAQAMMDKSIGLGQTYTDFVQTQMHEGLKLSQEAVKYGWTLAETVKKTAYDFTDRTMRNPMA
ncbi:MAG: hypothetical protein NDJ90_11770 [Oligoflexia bacterium]|nr:hypothetical protein [Oligoflexia bacterium]